MPQASSSAIISRPFDTVPSATCHRSVGHTLLLATHSHHTSSQTHHLPFLISGSNEMRSNTHFTHNPESKSILSYSHHGSAAKYHPITQPPLLVLLFLTQGLNKCVTHSRSRVQAHSSVTKHTNSHQANFATVRA